MNRSKTAYGTKMTAWRNRTHQIHSLVLAESCHLHSHCNVKCTLIASRLKREGKGVLSSQTSWMQGWNSSNSFNRLRKSLNNLCTAAQNFMKLMKACLSQVLWEEWPESSLSLHNIKLCLHKSIWHYTKRVLLEQFNWAVEGAVPIAQCTCRSVLWTALLAKCHFTHE